MGIIVSIVGHGLWYRLVPKYRTNQTMPFTLLIPVFGVSFGIVLGETLTWLMRRWPCDLCRRRYHYIPEIGIRDSGNTTAKEG